MATIGQLNNDTHDTKMSGGGNKIHATNYPGNPLPSSNSGQKMMSNEYAPYSSGMSGNFNGHANYANRAI